MPGQSSEVSYLASSGDVKPSYHSHSLEEWASHDGYIRTTVKNAIAIYWHTLNTYPSALRVAPPSLFLIMLTATSSPEGKGHSGARPVVHPDQVLVARGHLSC